MRSVPPRTSRGVVYRTGFLPTLASSPAAEAAAQDKGTGWALEEWQDPRWGAGSGELNNRSLACK